MDGSMAEAIIKHEQETPVKNATVLEINDILYTKDGRKTGNLTVVDVIDHKTTNGLIYYKCISDYGTTVHISNFQNLKQWYKETGTASKSHKYYNYKERFPEEFI